MNNISSLKNCYGCGVCSITCPEQIISLELNEEGFYDPIITDLLRCTECGLCLSVCAFNDNQIASQPKDIMCFSGWSNDKVVRNDCSSGGIGFEIGSFCINNGFKTCAVYYDTEHQKAKHFCASTRREFQKSMGSKYIQSYTHDGFKELNTKDKFVIFGTPCQIDSLRKFIQLKKLENNYILVDFFCHGVPSYNLWNTYLHLKTTKNELGPLKEVKFRDKKYGWHSYTIMIQGELKRLYSSIRNNDMFFRLFLGDLCLNECCYLSCKYKQLHSSADIRIGDLWGKKFQDDTLGVSGIICLTDKGKSIIEKLHRSCCIEEEDTEIITYGQMEKSPNLPHLRKWVLKKLTNKNILSSYSFLSVLQFYKYWRTANFRYKRFIKLMSK